MKKAQRKANRASRGQHLVSIIDNDALTDIIDFSDEQSSKVMAVEILKRRSYSCLTLRLLKGKEVARLESTEEYLFNISRVD